MIPPRLPNPSVYSTTYKDNPPIIKSDCERIKKEREAFKENLEGWDEITDPGDENIQQWNNRVSDTRSMSSRFPFGTGDDKEYYVYKVNNHLPIGMMGISEQKKSSIKDPQEKDYLYIDTIVAHPGVRGCGGALVEHAVNLSVKLGKNGRVYLTATPNSLRAYLEMGFSSSKECQMKMYLNPAESAMWSKNENGKWKLSKDMDKGYLATVCQKD